MPCTVLGVAVIGLGALYVPGGPAFAYAGEVPEASVRIGAGGRFAAELGGGGVVVEVEVESAVPVHLREAGRFDGYLLVAPEADLVASKDGGAVRVAPPVVGDAVGPTVFVGERSPGAPVRCRDLTLSSASGASSWSGPGEAVQRLDARGDALVLRRKPRGAVLGTLPGEMFGVVDARRGDSVRATVDLGAGFAVYGWFDAVDTEPVEIGVGQGLRPQAGPLGLAYADVARCDAAIPLAVEVGGAVTVLGSAAPGTPVIATGPARDDGWTAIVLPGGWFSPWDGRVSARTGATLLGPEAIRGCPTDPSYAR
ncbi:MAG: hypothetical protein V4850_04500 [Myxococcota bacterium]